MWPRDPRRSDSSMSVGSVRSVVLSARNETQEASYWAPLSRPDGWKHQLWQLCEELITEWQGRVQSGAVWAELCELHSGGSVKRPYFVSRICREAINRHDPAANEFIQRLHACSSPSRGSEYRIHRLLFVYRLVAWPMAKIRIILHELWISIGLRCRTTLTGIDYLAAIADIRDCLDCLTRSSTESTSLMTQVDSWLAAAVVDQKQSGALDGRPPSKLKPTVLWTSATKTLDDTLEAELHRLHVARLGDSSRIQVMRRDAEEAEAGARKWKNSIQLRQARVWYQEVYMRRRVLVVFFAWQHRRNEWARNKQMNRLADQQFRRVQLRASVRWMHWRAIRPTVIAKASVMGRRLLLLRIFQLWKRLWHAWTPYREFKQAEAKRQLERKFAKAKRWTGMRDARERAKLLRMSFRAIRSESGRLARKRGAVQIRRRALLRSHWAEWVRFRKNRKEGRLKQAEQRAKRRRQEQQAAAARKAEMDKELVEAEQKRKQELAAAALQRKRQRADKNDRYWQHKMDAIQQILRARRRGKILDERRQRDAAFASRWESEYNVELQRHQAEVKEWLKSRHGISVVTKEAKMMRTEIALSTVVEAWREKKNTHHVWMLTFDWSMLCRYFEHFESEERVWPQAKAFEGGLQLTKASALEMAAENLTAEKRHQFDKGMAAAKEQAYVEFMENRAATIMQRWCRRVTLWTTAIRMVDDLRRRHRNYRITQYWNEVDRHAIKMQAQWRGRQVRRWMPSYIQSLWFAAVDPETHKVYYQHYVTGEAQWDFPYQYWWYARRGLDNTDLSAVAVDQAEADVLRIPAVQDPEPYYMAEQPPLVFETKPSQDVADGPEKYFKLPPPVPTTPNAQPEDGEEAQSQRAEPLPEASADQQELDKGLPNPSDEVVAVAPTNEVAAVTPTNEVAAATSDAAGLNGVDKKAAAATSEITQPVNGTELNHFVPTTAEDQPDGSKDQVDAIPDQADGSNDQADAFPDQADGSNDQADAFPDQADGSKDQADAIPDQADGSKDQVDAIPDQADGSKDQADAFPDQADGSKDQADAFPDQADSHADLVADAAAPAINSEAESTDHFSHGDTNTVAAQVRRDSVTQRAALRAAARSAAAEAREQRRRSHAAAQDVFQLGIAEIHRTTPPDVAMMWGGAMVDGVATYIRKATGEADHVKPRGYRSCHRCVAFAQICSLESGLYYCAGCFEVCSEETTYGQPVPPGPIPCAEVWCSDVADVECWDCLGTAAIAFCQTCFDRRHTVYNGRGQHAALSIA